MDQWCQNYLITNPNVNLPLNSNDKLLILGDILKVEKNLKFLLKESFENCKLFGISESLSNFSKSLSKNEDIIINEPEVINEEEKIQFKFESFNNIIHNSKKKDLNKMLTEISLEEIIKKLKDRKLAKTIELKIKTEEILKLSIQTKKDFSDIFCTSSISEE